jgi:glycogen(starch) synthase
LQALKVLMFGWEFPPHISGGLGTACFGLTHALAESHTDVLFVVPKVFGDEPQQEVMLINASGVSLSRKELEQEIISRTNQTQITEITNQAERIKTIEIASSLSPYHSAREERTAWEIERWNYRFEQSEQKEVKSVTTSKNGEEIIQYSFSGGYGPRLLEEVARYANVASAISDKYSFDVIHAHDWMTYPAGIAAKKKSKKPLVVHVHATEYDRAGENMCPTVYRIEKEGMEAADKIVAVSKWTKDILVNHYKINKRKIKVVHNGVTPYESKIHRTKSPLGSHIVTFLGRITHQKGPKYFVEAAQKVLEVFPDAHFVMAGSGDLFPQIIERVAQLKLSSQFHFTGFLKKHEIHQLLSYTNVYVMPSVSEPFGITPLEAIQAGIPVIISNQSGVAEVMPHALKTDFWNSDAIADAICGVLKYESLSNVLKKNGKKEIENITWQIASQKLKKIYHELTKEN